MSDDKERMRALAAQLGVEVTQTPGRRTVGSDDTPSSGSNDTPTPTRLVSRPRPGVSAADAVRLAAIPDDSSVDTVEYDTTERGLHRALAKCQQENRSLREQLRVHQSREVEIVALGVQAQQHFAQAQQQLDGLKRRIRTELSHPVPPSEVNRLEALGEAQRDVVDTIRIVIAQQIGALQFERDAAVAKAAALDGTQAELRAAARRAEEELADAGARHQHDLATVEARAHLHEQRAMNLEQTLQQSALTVDHNQAKAARCDHTQADLDRTAKELAHARDDAATFEAKYRQAQADATAGRDNATRAELLLSKTQSELTFTAKERDNLAARTQELEVQCKRLSTVADEAQAIKVSAATTVTGDREEMRLSFERRLASETERLREIHADEIVRVRTAAREASEREASALLEARDIAVADCGRQRQELEEARSCLELHRATASSKLDELKQELFETRLQVTHKTNDGLRLDLALREAEGRLERSKGDQECLQRKLDILKEEFYEMKAQHREETLGYQARITTQDEQLQLLKDMETEAEVFMTHLARTKDDPSEAAAILADIPTSRRLTHTVTVTKRALALENQLSIAKHDLGVAQLKANRASEDLEMARNVLRDRNSPYLALEATLKRRDDEATQMRALIEHLRSENTMLEGRCEHMAADIKTLSGHRDEIIRIRELLRGLDPQRRSAAQLAVLAKNRAQQSAQDQGQGQAQSAAAASSANDSGLRSSAGPVSVAGTLPPGDTSAGPAEVAPAVGREPHYPTEIHLQDNEEDVVVVGGHPGLTGDTEGANRAPGETTPPTKKAGRSDQPLRSVASGSVAFVPEIIEIH